MNAQAGTILRAACSPGEIRVAITRDHVLEDYAIARPGAPDGVGDLHRGRVLAHLPALAGAFVALQNQPDGFLPDSEGGANTSPGNAIGVRITRAAQGEKGPRLSARLPPEDAALIGTGKPALIRRGPDALDIMAALHPALPVLVDDAALAAARRPALASRLRVQTTVFDDAIEAQIAALAEPDVVLDNGIRLRIHPTPALAAIDIDTAGFDSRRQSKTAAHGLANRAALPELARQIRLRNLSGAILVDFAGLSPKRRAALAPDLHAALAADPLQPRLLGFTQLGLAEITRPRIHPPLHEILSGPHAAGLAALRHLAAQALADPARRLGLVASPAIVARLQADPAALDAMAARLGRPLPLKADPRLPDTAWAPEDA